MTSNYLTAVLRELCFLGLHSGLLLLQRWRASLVVYSAAVSVKMNVLLMAPPVLVVLLKVHSSHPSPSNALLPNTKSALQTQT